MTNNEIVQKLWNLCNVLRDDGITYHEYVTELTKFQHYCESKIRNRRKKSKKAK